MKQANDHHREKMWNELETQKQGETHAHTLFMIKNWQRAISEVFSREVKKLDSIRDATF